MHQTLRLRGVAAAVTLLACLAFPAWGRAQQAEATPEAATAPKQEVHEPPHETSDAKPHGEKPHGEGEHEEGVPGFKKDLAIWSLVVFLIFAALLGKFAWKPLIAGLDKRESAIRGDIAAAEQARLKAEQMLAEHSAKLSKVQDEVREILAEARRDAEHTKQEIVTEAQKEAEASKRRSIGEIERAKDAAIKDLFDVMANQVASATEHVLSRSLSGPDQDRLIDEALAQFPRN